MPAALPTIALPLVLALLAPRGPDPSLLRDGDVIFHESRSAQSRAIAEVQGSPYTHVGLIFRRGGRWWVLEAVQPVRWTPLDRWVARGGRWRLLRRRAGPLTPAEAGKLRRAAERFLGRPYDLRFEWSDAALYCSELVWKAYHRALDLDLGGRVDWSTLDLSGPHATALLRTRGPRPTGPIVTPAALLASPHLTEIAAEPHHPPPDPAPPPSRAPR